MDAPIWMCALKDTDIIGELLGTRQLEERRFYLCRQLSPRVQHGEVYLFYSEKRWEMVGKLPSQERGSIGADKDRWRRVLPYQESHWLRSRAIVLARDHYTCQLCGATEKSSGRALHVHHIVPRQSCDSNMEANDSENLITLCYICHPHVECQDHVDSHSVVATITIAKAS